MIRLRCRDRLCLWVAMRTCLSPFLAGIFCVLSVARVEAADLRDFHEAVAGAYGHYRQSVFYIRTENAAVAVLELDEFVTKWTGVVDRFADAPPPAFAADAEWRASLEEIRERAANGLEALDAGRVEVAVDALMPIRRLLGELRQRNGVIVFSDHIDELSAAMDVLARYRREVTDLNDASMAEPARRQAAVVAYLFDKVRRNAPDSVSADPEFARTYEGVAESMDRLWRGFETRDLRLYRIGIGELHSHERLLYLRFG